jgi:putative mRNA 3-end processing factor
LIEQGLHIGLRHATQRRRAEPHQPEPGAMAITDVAGQRFLERCDGRLALAEFFADAAEREPGGCEIRRQLDRLHQQVGGGGQIALQLQVARKFEPAVSHQIAGGQEEAGRHLGEPTRHCRALVPDLIGDDPAIQQSNDFLRRWMRGSSPRMTAKLCGQGTYMSGMRPQDILIPVPAGLCCKPGGFHIDPVRPVERAVITHGHSDHARAGHGAVLATQETLDMMRLRYGDDFARNTQVIRYGEELTLGDVKVKFHPAGHVLGSAQIAVSCKDTCIVASGDYKDASDPTCTPFEVVPCDVFITEATFGLPVFRHGDAAEEVKKLLASVALFPERAHLVGAYSLGKAQRVIALLREQGYDAPVYLHGAMEKITHYYESRGIALGELRPVKGMKKADLAGTITLAPPSATSDIWTRRFPDPVTAFASGWMRVRARARQRGVELPLVISDHADWDGLTATIEATGAGEVWVTHGQEDALVHWCKSRGLAARPLDLVGYGDEEEHEAVAADGADA